MNKIWLNICWLLGLFFFCDIWLYRFLVGWLKVDYNLVNLYRGFIRKCCFVYWYIFLYYIIKVKIFEMKIIINICKFKRFIILLKKGIVFWGKILVGLIIYWLDIFKFVG